MRSPTQIIWMAKTLGENAFFGVPRRPLHDPFFGRFRCKCKSWKSVGYKVDPEDMNRQQRDGKTQKRRKEYGPYLAGIARHGVFYEFSDIVEDPSASMTALTMVAKLSSRSIIWAASFETSVPVIPMATPISARLNAGASFTPSPVMATYCPLSWSAFTIFSFCSGATRA